MHVGNSRGRTVVTHVSSAIVDVSKSLGRAVVTHISGHIVNVSKSLWRAVVTHISSGIVDVGQSLYFLVNVRNNIHLLGSGGSRDGGEDGEENEDVHGEDV